jgi:hypothetical protein
VAIHVSLLVLSLTLQLGLGHWIWTGTAGVHAVLTFMLFHWIKGTPFPTIDSDNQSQTQWEQLDDEEEGYAYVDYFRCLVSTHVAHTIWQASVTACNTVFSSTAACR